MVSSQLMVQVSACLSTFPSGRNQIGLFKMEDNVRIVFIVHLCWFIFYFQFPLGQVLMGMSVALERDGSIAAFDEMN